MGDSSPHDLSAFTPEQAAAIAASGNVLVVAGAGTGKTRTLVERCVQNLLHKNIGLDQILMVTFTDAAAAEMRQRIRERLEQEQATSSGIAEQLALLENASVCTLHSFCLQLIRQHFYELQIDPQLSVLTEQQTRVLQEETFDALFDQAYAGSHRSATEICALIDLLGSASDRKLRELIRQIHEHTQTRPDPAAWFAHELQKLESPNPELWSEWLREAGSELCRFWLPLLQASAAECAQLKECLHVLGKIDDGVSRKELAAALACIRQIDASDWERGTAQFRKPFKGFFDDVEFLYSVAASGSSDPLLEDWQWSAPHLRTLLRLSQEFAERFGAAKRDQAVLDFHDLEQFALRLLWENGNPTSLAVEWQEKFKLAFVDEYQDINPAQDQILRALSRSGPRANRFLVGDVKQSIYGFRQAEPGIFLRYASEWKSPDKFESRAAEKFSPLTPALSPLRREGEEEPRATFRLSENFRSRERLLDFINAVFGGLMQRDLGGINYRNEAELQFGNQAERVHLARNNDPEPRAEIILCLPAGQEVDEDDRSKTEREACVIAQRLKEIHTRGEMIWDERQKTFRKAEWRDMVILLRAPSGKVESFAREFDKAGVPLLASGGGLFEALEVQDLLNVLRILDNPLQDRPLIAVLRSPLAGLSADELVQIRLAARKASFWNALEGWHEAARAKAETPTSQKIAIFLERFRRWRSMARCSSLTQRLEAILEEANYLDWLLTQNRPEQRRANVQQLLRLTREFDQLHRQSLHPFLQFLQNEEEAGADREPPPVAASDAVRLMTIHKSKGLEFPIVVLADLGKPFNTNDSRGELILDSDLGLCARVHAPETGQSYPSLPFWLAKKRLASRALAEELRLLYVAMTRAQEMLILSGTCSEKKAQNWIERAGDYNEVARLRCAGNCLDWLGPWLSATASSPDWAEQPQGVSNLWRWKIVRAISATAPAALEAVPTEHESVSCIEVENLQARLTWTYPDEAATLQPAKSSVTALRRESANELELATPFVTPKFVPAGSSEDTLEIGLAHHQFLQWLDLSLASAQSGLEQERARLVTAKLLTSEQARRLDLPAIARFWNSEIGREILRHQKKIQRELPFTVRLTRQSDPSIPVLSRIPEGEFIVIQGAIDLAVFLENEIWILDFKTDRAAGQAIAAKAQEYSIQLRLYALALSQIYRKPVTRCWIHFLHVGQTISVNQP